MLCVGHGRRFGKVSIHSQPKVRRSQQIRIDVDFILDGSCLDDYSIHCRAILAILNPGDRTKYIIVLLVYMSN